MSHGENAAFGWFLPISSEVAIVPASQPAFRPFEHWHIGSLSLEHRSQIGIRSLRRSAQNRHQIPVFPAAIDSGANLEHLAAAVILSFRQSIPQKTLGL